MRWQSVMGTIRNRDFLIFRDQIISRFTLFIVITIERQMNFWKQVVIVGSASSGADLTEEIASTANRVYWCSNDKVASSKRI